MLVVVCCLLFVVWSDHLTNYQLPITNNQQPTTNKQRPMINDQLMQPL